MKKRVHIFIDGSNFYHQLIKLLGHSRLGDYGEFFRRLMNADQVLVAVTYYIGKINS